MARIARRSVASDPSSQATNNNSINRSHKPESSTPDPLRSNGSQFTTRIVPTHYDRYGNGTTSTIQPGSYNNNINSNKPVHNNQSTYAPLPTNATIARNLNSTRQAEILAERERVRMEFYATYDVMTGVRIAATLGGFFGLMVFLIVWKSRSHSNETLKVLKDPKIAAVAAACMQEEEDREIQEAMDATGLSIYPDEYDAMLFRRQRMLSLGNVSAPSVLHRGHRFSSIGGGGGYSTLLEPARRFSYSYGASGRRTSGSDSFRYLSNYPMGSSFGTDDYFVETDDELENANFPNENQHHQPDGLLAVPPLGHQDARRSSAMTCCSTESSYLERRCSALTLGLSNLPPTLRRKLSTASRASSTDIWDYYYPDIQIIEATPKGTPCPSERSLYDDLKRCGGRAAVVKKPQPPLIRKQSIAYYDPESAQGGRRQQIHSISADAKDFYPPTTSIPPTPMYKFEVNERRTEEPAAVATAKPSDTTSVTESSVASYVAATATSAKRAPLASLSSFKISSLDYQDSEMRSLDYDSVFLDSIADTDDDMEQFSTDSDGDDDDDDDDEPAKQPPVLTTITNSVNNRPILQRTQSRTLSPSPSDKIFLIAQSSDNLPMHDLTTTKSSQPSANERLETHFSTAECVIGPTPVSASSSPLNTRKPTSIVRHLQQQISDPQSLATTTDDTTTPETCSTLNTEILQDVQHPTSSSSSRRRTILSFSSRDNNNDSSLSSNNHLAKTPQTIVGGGGGGGGSTSKLDDSSNNSSSKKNVEVNVVIENVPIIVSVSSTSSSKSTSQNLTTEDVALELPVIHLSHHHDHSGDSTFVDSNSDESNHYSPAAGGSSSRKWSKETLF